MCRKDGAIRPKKTTINGITEKEDKNADSGGASSSTDKQPEAESREAKENKGLSCGIKPSQRENYRRT